jgi:hypothetical protein
MHQKCNLSLSVQMACCKSYGKYKEYEVRSKSIWPFFFNKKAFVAGSGAHVTLDLHAHAWIIASRSDCSVTDIQPKHGVVCRIDDDRETWTAHLHQVLPETSGAHTHKPMISPLWIRILISSLQQISGYCKVSLFLLNCQHFWDKFRWDTFHAQILSEWTVPNQTKAPTHRGAL